MIKSILLVSICSLSVYSTELSPYYPLVEKQDKYVQDRNQRQAGKEIFHQDKLQTKEILKSNKKMAFLRKGTLLFNIKTEKTEYYPSEGHIRIYERADDWGYLYLDNGKNELEYKVKGEEIISLRNDLAMFSSPHRFTETIKKVTKDTDDLNGVTHIALFSDSIQAQATGATTTGQSISGSGLRGELGHLIGNENTPLYFGLVAQAERQTHAQGVNSSSWGIGPAIRTRPFSIFQFELMASSQATMGITKVNASGQDIPNFNGQFISLQMALEHPFVFNKTNIIAGVGLRRQWYKFSIKNDATKSGQYDQSLAFLVGILFGDLKP